MDLSPFHCRGSTDLVSSRHADDEHMRSQAMLQGFSSTVNHHMQCLALRNTATLQFAPKHCRYTGATMHCCAVNLFGPCALLTDRVRFRHWTNHRGDQGVRVAGMQLDADMNDSPTSWHACNTYTVCAHSAAGSICLWAYSEFGPSPSAHRQSRRSGSAPCYVPQCIY